MTHDERLRDAKIEYREHRLSGCKSCLQAIYDVMVPACPVAVELDRAVRAIIEESVITRQKPALANLKKGE